MNLVILYLLGLLLIACSLISYAKEGKTIAFIISGIGIGITGFGFMIEYTTNYFLYTLFLGSISLVLSIILLFCGINSMISHPKRRLPKNATMRVIGSIKLVNCRNRIYCSFQAEIVKDGKTGSFIVPLKKMLNNIPSNSVYEIDGKRNARFVQHIHSEITQ